MGHITRRPFGMLFRCGLGGPQCFETGDQFPPAHWLQRDTAQCQPPITNAYSRMFRRVCCARLESVWKGCSRDIASSLLPSDLSHWLDSLTRGFCDTFSYNAGLLIQGMQRGSRPCSIRKSNPARADAVFISRRFGAACVWQSLLRPLWLRTLSRTLPQSSISSFRPFVTRFRSARSCLLGTHLPCVIDALESISDYFWARCRIRLFTAMSCLSDGAGLG